MTERNRFVVARQFETAGTVEYPWPPDHALQLINWKVEGFDLESAFAREQGTYVEVGGPSDFTYDILQTVSNPPAFRTSNIHLDAPQFDGLTGKATRPKRLNVDFVADAGALPFEEGSLAGIFGANLAPTPDFPGVTRGSVISRTIQEAARVLKPGGLLVLQGVLPTDGSFVYGIRDRLRLVQVVPEGSRLTVVLEKEA